MGAIGFLIMCYFALVYDTTVETDGMFGGGGVHNMGLLVNRIVGVLFGGFLMTVAAAPAGGRVRPQHR